MNVKATARLFALGTETGKRGERWCYIAGPMRSKPNFNYEAFNQAAKTLRDYGWHVFNPAETDAEVRDAAEASPNPLSVYMQQDLVDVCKSDVVFVLDGWGLSEGARLEVSVADQLGIPVYSFPHLENFDAAHALRVLAEIAELEEPTPPPRFVLDHVTPAGDPVTKHFDHEKGHLVNSPSRAEVSDRPIHLDRAATDAYRAILAAGRPESHDEPLDLSAFDRPEELGGPGQVWPVREFDSGASRNPDTNKPDYEGFLSPVVIEAFGRYMHEHRKQGDSLRSSDNWQKGIPLPEYMKSLWRHFLHVWLLHRGHEALDPDTGKPVSLEDALCGVLFNTNGYLHEALKGVDTVTHSG